MPENTTERLRQTILQLAESRAPGSTFCPSEVARAVSPENWRPLMPAVKAAALKLHTEDKLYFYQKWNKIEPRDINGPYRLGKK